MKIATYYESLMLVLTSIYNFICYRQFNGIFCQLVFVITLYVFLFYIRITESCLDN